MRKSSVITVLLSAVLLAATLFAACSPKKNTAATRRYQAFITRYNIYFNGDQHYKETLRQMEEGYEDDYSRRLFLHPADAYADPKAPHPGGSFERSIEKAQKAIQLRSIKKRPRRKAGKGSDPAYKAWLKREEYNPFLHNAWLMMGRSQYMGGDFPAAAATFSYIAKHFSWLPATVTEARIWQARAYIGMGWNFEAENILRTITPEMLVNSTLKGLFPLVKADQLIAAGDTEQAIPWLSDAIRHASGAQKTRLTFLLGQLLEQNGKPTEAYKAFEQVAKSQGASYRTKFNARIKQSEVYQGANVEPEVRSLRSMLRYGRNKEYADQIYYAIGNLYLSRRDTTKAIENYRLASEKSTRNGIDKALAQVKLGGLYFDRGQYDLAQPEYSAAVPLLSESYPGYKEMKRRSDVLDELAVYSQNVTLQDSLLRLSAMTPDQQRKVVDRIIDELKKKEKEEAEAAAREDYLADQAAKGNQNANQSTAATQSFTMNNDKSWYFYNNTVKQAGKTEFQKRWGSRKLEDDWRRRNKSSFSFSDFDQADTDGLPADSLGPDGTPIAGNDAELSPDDKAAADSLARLDDPHFPEYYLRQIPKDDAERQTAHDIIQEGRYNMGVILKDKLEDYPSAERQFTILLTDYPDNIYRLDTYYNLYLMLMRAGDTARAEQYRQLILSQFPESELGLAMRDPRYLDNLREMNARQEALYEQTYNAFIQGQSADSIHATVADVKQRYPMSPIMPKFMFIDALAFVTQNDKQNFGATLKELLERYPDTDITPVASSWLKLLGQGRELNSTGSTAGLRSMIWDTRLTLDSTLTVTPDSLLTFDLDETGPHLLILTFPTDSVSANQLLYDIARHNFNTFTIRDFDLEPMNFGTLGMLIVSGFVSARDIDAYRNTLNGIGLPEAVRPVVISKKNFDLLLKQGASFDAYFRAIEDARLRQTHEQTLPPDQYPPASEMYDTDGLDQLPPPAADEAPTDEEEPTEDAPAEEEPTEK